MVTLVKADAKEIRVVRDSRGRSRGFAYVEFDNEVSAQVTYECWFTRPQESLEKGLKLNKTDVDGKPISVNRSKPPTKSKLKRKQVSSLHIPLSVT